MAGLGREEGRAEVTVVTTVYRTWLAEGLCHKVQSGLYTQVCTGGEEAENGIRPFGGKIYPLR